VVPESAVSGLVVLEPVVPETVVSEPDALEPRAPAVPDTVVAGAYLEPLSRNEFSSIDRDQAARLLDDLLRQVATQEAAHRLKLGSLASGLQKSHGYHRLGFARIGDYAVERLGISGRQLQLAATVRRKLDALPTLTRAYLSGRLNWTKLVLILRAATQQSAAGWLDLATTRTSRELRVIVEHWMREVRTGSAEFGAVGRRGTLGDLENLEDDEHEIDSEPRAALRIRCPARLRSLWREVAELASKSSGSPLADWQTLELIAAEAA
jgi:hypothetical protein